MAIYASLQTTFNQLLLPHIEVFLLHLPAFQKIKDKNDTISVPEVPTSKDSNHTHNVIAPASTAEETISEPSEYEVMRTNAIAKQDHAIQAKLEKVISYTKQTMVAYMSEEDLNRLCAYVAEYSTGDTLQKISPVKVDTHLKALILCILDGISARLFGRKRILYCNFHQECLFPYPTSTWKSQLLSAKMSHTESGCKIRLNLNIT